MENEYIIPANYTDAGKLLGVFEIRSAAEAILLCVPLALILLKLSPFGLTGTVVLVSAPCFTLGGFALTGIQDRSLLEFLRIFLLFRKRRRILTYRGTKWILRN